MTNDHPGLHLDNQLDAIANTWRPEVMALRARVQTLEDAAEFWAERSRSMSAEVDKLDIENRKLRAQNERLRAEIERVQSNHG